MQEEQKNIYGLLLPFSKEKKLATDLPVAIKEAVDNALSANLLSDSAESRLLLTVLSQGRLYNVLMLIVDEESTNRLNFVSIGKAIKSLGDLGCVEIDIITKNMPYLEADKDFLQKLFELAFLVAYQNNKYLSKKKSNFKPNFSTSVDNAAEVIEKASIISSATNRARDLINEPSMFMSPELFAQEVKKIADESGFSAEVLNEKECEKLGMNAFLAVGKGSVNKPCLIVMKYNGNPSSDKQIALVGKGVMMDTGGYSLKSTMHTMHGDMAGGGAVVAAMESFAKTKIKANVVGIVAACENRISGDAYVPGDILTSMSGITIDMLNTDAEGRLTLADALTYVIRTFNPDVVVDIATLTGSVGGALGNRTAGIMSNRPELIELTKIASEKSCEKVWQLDLDKELMHVMKSKFADIKNTAVGSTAGGGTGVAGLFLEQFVESKPWLHIDIASVGNSTTTEYLYDGATGYGVSLMYNIVSEWIK